MTNRILLSDDHRLLEAAMEISCSFGIKLKNLFATRVFLISAYAIIAIPTFLLNLLVLVSIWKTSSLHKPSQILLANLALADMLAGIVGEPYLVFSNLAVINGWVHSVCIAWIILATYSFGLATISMYTLAIISIDRFLAIRLRFNYRTVVTNKRLMYVMSAGWSVIGCLYITAVVLLFNNRPQKPFLILFILYVALVLCVITLFYSMAFYHLKKVSSQVSNPIPAPNPTPNFDINKYRRSFNTMLIVLVAAFIFFMPYLCFSILEAVFKEASVFSHCARVGECFLALNSLVNPLLYLWRIRDLREAAKGTAKRIFKC